MFAQLHASYYSQNEKEVGDTTQLDSERSGLEFTHKTLQSIPRTSKNKKLQKKIHQQVNLVDNALTITTIRPHGTLHLERDISGQVWHVEKKKKNLNYKESGRNNQQCLPLQHTHTGTTGMTGVAPAQG